MPSHADLTYREVGATRGDHLPPGYAHVRRDTPIASGRDSFRQAADGLFAWNMHRRAGLHVTEPAEPAAPGVDVLLRVGWRPFRLAIPCRVVYTLAEPNRRGFAYGTLPGHPEQGEEAFLLELTEAGEVHFRIRAFSRPASLLARTGGPVTRLVQQHVTDRYVRALRDLADPVRGSTGPGSVGPVGI